MFISVDCVMLQFIDAKNNQLDLYIFLPQTTPGKPAPAPGPITKTSEPVVQSIPPAKSATPERDTELRQRGKSTSRFVA